MKKDEITILVADDHPIFRKGLVEVIAAEAGMRVLAEAGNGEEALARISELQPDVAVLDIKMPGKSGFDVARALQQGGCGTRIVFLTMHKEEDMFNAALDLGATGYVLKECAADDIAECIRAAALGKYYISPEIGGFLVNRGRRSPLAPKTELLDALTEMERKILTRIARKKTSTEIAAELCLSRRTVENHRMNMCNKLGLHGINALLLFAVEHKDIIE